VAQHFGSVCDVEGCDQPASISFWGLLVCEDHSKTSKWKFRKEGKVLHAERLRD
jgi:hypothetical protein